ncbi:MAG: phosphotriesterase, partial [Gemmatimonadota bacterium]|nr:phosphotriesterase [Gemmatimonadota bacterium]
ADGPSWPRRPTDVPAFEPEGLLDRVLVSHDAGWYHVGEPGGGTFRQYDTLFTEFLSALEAAGFTNEEIHQLTVVDPDSAFLVRVRARSP